MYAANVIILGNKGVGKSTLVRRYLGGDFSEDYDPTKGVKAFIDVTEIGNYDVLLTLLDTPCDQDYYPDKADIIIVMFSLTDQDSFEKAKTLIEEINNTVPTILVGAKRDLKDQRVVEVFENLGVPSIEISSKSLTDVSSLFDLVGAELTKHWKGSRTCLRCRFCIHCGYCYCCNC